MGANAKTSYETPLGSGQLPKELNKDNFLIASTLYGLGLGLILRQT